MLTHGNPFFVYQLIWFGQNVVWHAHLSNIMQERAVPYVYQFFFGHSFRAGKFQC